MRLVRYEDMVAAPDAELARVFDFLELAPFTADWKASPGLNSRYLHTWHRIPLGPLTRPVLPAGLGRGLSERVLRFGYSLSAPEHLLDPAPELAPYFAGR